MDESRERGRRGRSIDELSDPAQSVPPDRVLSAVANRRRRAVLYSLKNASGGTLEYDTLVDRVADRTREGDEEGVSEERRQRLQIAIHHSHLPKLEESQLVEYETDTGHVRFTGDELTRELLMLVRPHDAVE